jgi:hypothetical protein
LTKKKRATRRTSETKNLLTTIFLRLRRKLLTKLSYKNQMRKRKTMNKSKRSKKKSPFHNSKR